MSIQHIAKLVHSALQIVIVGLSDELDAVIVVGFGVCVAHKLAQRGVEVRLRGWRETNVFDALRLRIQHLEVTARHELHAAVHVLYLQRHALIRLLPLLFLILPTPQPHLERQIFSTARVLAREQASTPCCGGPHRTGMKGRSEHQCRHHSIDESSAGTNCHPACGSAVSSHS